MRVRFGSTNAWPRYIRRWRAGAGWVATAAAILALNSPTVVAVDIDENVSLLTSEEGDKMTRLISLLAMEKHADILLHVPNTDFRSNTISVSFYFAPHSTFKVIMIEQSGLSLQKHKKPTLLRRQVCRREVAYRNLDGAS